MLAEMKNLSLVEQKKLQWAKEREELVGLCGLWGKPKNYLMPKNKSDQTAFYGRNNLLPPIQSEEPSKQYRGEEESETSGYLSDSPKRNQQGETPEAYQELMYKEPDVLHNDESGEEIQQNYWSDVERAENNYWADKKMYKNYKNENWNHQKNDFTPQKLRMHQNCKNYWYATPGSASSDDGCRLKWGDRGIGIGHLWDPVTNSPDCRLPQVLDQYRQAPKWVEKGLKNHDGSKSEVLIINHPDDELEYKSQKNFLLGQNVPIPPEVIEEREQKRKKALEHQNAIKKQLEEREFKRKQEKEKRIQEERLEEERIKKEQEIERLRYEEEQRKIKEKEQMDRKREEMMKEAIEVAEKRAREEKKRAKRHTSEDEQKNSTTVREKYGKIEKTIQPTELGLTQRKQNKKIRKGEVTAANNKQNKEEQRKVLRDSFSQFEEIQLANSFQLLNVNGLPVDGGLALMLDNTPKDSNFILPPDGVQLALLMSPRNTGAANQLLPFSSPFPELTSGERTLTPSKYRIYQRHCNLASNKSTQTDFRCSSGWMRSDSAGKRRRLSVRCGKPGNSTPSHKSGNTEKLHKHGRCFNTSKHRSKLHASKLSLEDRPKWGINRPSVQYKKQSEKDPYYQKKLKDKLKHLADAALLSSSSDQTLKNEEEEVENLAEKELNSVVRLLELRKDVNDGGGKERTEIILQNGFRMNSNLSSPVFVPIDNRINPDWGKSKKLDVDSDKSMDTPRDHEDMSEPEEEEKTANFESERFLTPLQVEAIEKITCLREGLKNLQKDLSNSRSTTPFSDRSIDK